MSEGVYTARGQKSKGSFYIIFFLLLGVNQIIRYSIITSNTIYYINNSSTFGIVIPVFVLFVVIVLATISFYKLNIMTKHPIQSALILSGAWSNMSEFVLYGSVVDYIPYGYGYANSADIMIWAGFVLFQFVIWSLPNTNMSNNP